MRFHGVLVELDGTGVLLAGPSGAGKSECALELIARGHRLIADDAVELSLEDGRVMGRAAEAVAGHIEIRGLGILSVPDLYGPDAWAEEAPVDLICRIDPAGEAADRRGLERESEELLGVALPRVVLASRPGASLAAIVDAAARDERARRRGCHGAERFDRRLQRLARRP